MTPLISIIIPTKDRGEVFNDTILAALKAIRNFQIEVIVVNDSKGSFAIINTDATFPSAAIQ